MHSGLDMVKSFSVICPPFMAKILYMPVYTTYTRRHVGPTSVPHRSYTAGRIRYFLGDLVSSTCGSYRWDPPLREVHRGYKIISREYDNS